MPRLLSEEAAQLVNFNIFLFWIVSSALSLHVEFLSIVVGVGDNQTMAEVCHVFISFNVALCAYVLVCLDVPSACLCLHALPFFKRSVLVVASSLRKLEN